MKFILLTSLFFSYATSNAQTITWQKSLGSSKTDGANCVKQTIDGGYIIAASAGGNDGDVSSNHGNSDYWIIRLNANGDTLWTKSFGGSSLDVATSIQQTKGGGYIVAGYTSSNDGDVKGNHGNFDCWILKLNANGDTLWTKILGGSNNDEAYSIEQTSDGGYIMTASTSSNDGDVTGNHGQSDYWLVKFDVDGNIKWQHCYGGNSDDDAFCVQQTTDKGYIVGGRTLSNNGDVHGNHSFGNDDAWIIKLNKDGDTLWTKTVGGSNSDVAQSIQQTVDGGYIVAGASASNDGDITDNHGFYDYLIIKLNSKGKILWTKTLGGSNYDWAESIQQTTDSGFIVTGFAFSNDGDVSGNHGNDDAWTIKLNNNGDTVWTKSLGGSGAEVGSSVEQTSDNGYIIAGLSSSNDGDVSNNHGDEDVWVVKLNDGVLATNLIKLNALVKDGAVQLSWQTAEEANSNYFVIEKSMDGKNFSTVSTTPADGNSSIIRSYLVIDDHPIQGISYYRLKEIDKDNHSNYSSVVKVDFEVPSITIVKPNPVKNMVQIQVRNCIQCKAQIEVVDINGNSLIKAEKNFETGNNSFSLSVQFLNTGNYFIKIIQDNIVSITRFIKQ